MLNPSPRSVNSHYHRQSLQNEDIRLFKIVSIEPILCLETITASLLDSPAYTALSYVRGNPQFTEHILVDHTAVAVSPNLADALRHLHTHWTTAFSNEDVNSCLLWADAVCINQQDLGEKSQEAKLMGSIYWDADLVFSWLGLGNREVYAAFAVLKKVAREIHSNGYDDGAAPNVGWLERHPELCAEDVPHEWIGNTTWQLILKVLELDYWQRVWIVQELALAQRLIIACGTETVSLDDALTFAKWQYKVARSSSQRPPYITENIWNRVYTYTGRGPWSRLSAIFYIKKQAKVRATMKMLPDAFLDANSEWRQGYEGVSVMVALKSALWKVTDPKDLIYGFLGLTDLDISPEYGASTSVADVYRAFFETWINCAFRVEEPVGELAEPLKPLRYSGIGFKGQRLRYSWAPDLWRMSQGFIPLPDSMLNPSDAYSADRGLFDASHSRCFIKEASLFTPAARLDHIARLGPLIGELREPHGLASYIFDYIKRRPFYITGEHALAAIVKVLYCAAPEEVQAGSHSLNRSLELFRYLQDATSDHALRMMCATGGPSTHVVPFYGQDFLSRVGLQRIYDDAHSVDIDPGKVLSAQAFIGRVNETHTFKAQLNAFLSAIVQISNLRLAETNSGYLGLVPPLAGLGDEICILRDLRTPTLLRTKQGQGWSENVGSCFMYGMMKGEIQASQHVKIELMEIR